MTEKEQPSVSSTEELDKILLEQLMIARKSKKILKRHKKLLKNDINVEKGDRLIDGKINFLESMIVDKTLLHKRIKIKEKKKKEKDPDILARSSSYEWYRNIMIVTNIGYRIVTEYFQSYMSFFINKKGKD